MRCTPTPRPVLLAEIVIVTFVLILAYLVLRLSLKERVESSAAKNRKDGEMVPPCGDGWIWYRNKCFYFSKGNGDWTEAKDSCAALSSSLAMIDTQEELDFILRYKGDHDHWIGLRRKNPDQPWIWVDGTGLNNWFTVADYSECAYLSYHNVKSLECYSTRKWICTKNAHI